MSEVTKVKPTIDTSLFAKICEDTMKQIKPGTPFVPTPVRLSEMEYQRRYRENACGWCGHQITSHDLKFPNKCGLCPCDADRHPIKE